MAKDGEGDEGRKSWLDDVLGLSERKNIANLCKSLIAEIIGVLFINYFGVLPTIELNELQTQSVNVALSFGLVIAAGVYALAHLSGGHFNPAITIALLVAQKVNLIRAVLYIIAQCIGAIAGAGLLKMVTPSLHQGVLGATLVHEKLSVFQGAAVEFIVTFLLVLVVFGVTDANKPQYSSVAPLAIGLTVVVGILSSGQQTGASINPARSFGPALVSGTWDNHWVYWLGPCAGGIVASLLYTYVLRAPQKKEMSLS